MADQNQNSTINPFEALSIVLNPNGSLTRHPHPLSSLSLKTTKSVVCTDIPLNPNRNTSIRIYHPPINPTTPKIPLIIYFHGGGFVIFSATSPPYGEFCLQIASELPALVLSVGYRLAPENRLPSAYEDALDAVLWVKNHAFKGECKYNFFDYVDFSKCFVMGSSSGGNITYKLGLQALKLNLEPLKINGLIMIQPFFSRVERSESELRLANDNILPLPVTDLMWELSLPVGADRDHQYCNPMAEGGSEEEEIKGLPRCYVRGHDGDPLIDRQKEFVKMLEGCGAAVVKDFSDDGFHACELFDATKGQELIKKVRDFIYSSSS